MICYIFDFDNSFVYGIHLQTEQITYDFISNDNKTFITSLKTFPYYILSILTCTPHPWGPAYNRRNRNMTCVEALII